MQPTCPETTANSQVSKKLLTDKEKKRLYIAYKIIGILIFIVIGMFFPPRREYITIGDYLVDFLEKAAMFGFIGHVATIALYEFGYFLYLLLAAVLYLVKHVIKFATRQNNGEETGFLPFSDANNLELQKR